MKIKTKITIGIGTILLTSGIVFNLTFRNILNERMENTIKESVSQIMNSTMESVKYRNSLSSTEPNEDKLKNGADYLVSYISLNNSCNIQIRDNSNKILASNTAVEFGTEIDKNSTKALNGSAVILIKYSNSSVYGILSYPIYIDDIQLGTLTIEKEYNDIYLSNLSTINLITVSEVVIFLCIFFTALLITSTVTHPIIALTEGVKKIEEGDYNFSIKSKHNDEVGILSKEFINMKDKIKEQIQTIKEEQLKVETLEKHREEFFNNVTHELKTPLTAITGYSEMLKDDIVIDPDFKKRAVERIYVESDRAHKLVLDLITVSKGQTQISEAISEIHMKPLISEIIEDMSLKANKYSLNINYTIEDGIVLGQQNKLKQLFINIIDNAIKYSFNSNIISVNCYCKENFYFAEISNSSMGIPENVYNKIFDPFIKTNSSPDNYSSGLGLYISKQIVTSHGGNIYIINGEIVTVKIEFTLL
ncbi:HAMP domain-containing sensor histidine kinase [Clostridium sp. HBUAS56017]|uniref:sensor histidine kinase n=1 Tax=Clostridium sp. HBUAS56017 TaxID=2571128 RepID=UPI001178C221|nr:HAMP domain-containing sensor histidine kinase [Clostridium sp. HBUAS56017]